MRVTHTFHLWVDFEGEHMPSVIGTWSVAEPHATNPMPRFAEAFGFGMRHLDGLTAASCEHHLEAAIERMEDKPTFFKWLCGAGGSNAYASDLTYLRRVLRACQRHPRAVVRI